MLVFSPSHYHSHLSTHNKKVVNVFFVSLIAGSAFDQLSSLIGSPMSIVSLLGDSIPRTGYFFTNYVMLQGMKTKESGGSS